MKYLFALAALLFLGCSGSEPKAEPVSYPSWYLNPPANNASYLYGVGEGSDINQAKAAALSFVSESLSLTVSSEFEKRESRTQFNDERSSFSSVVSNIKAQAKAMEFSEYRIINNQQVGTKIILLIEVSRERLFRDQKRRLERYAKALREEKGAIAKQPLIKQALLYKERADKQYELKSLALLAETINPGFEIEPYLRQSREVGEAEVDAQNRVKVSISASTEMQPFLDALKEGFNKAGIKTGSRGANTFVHLSGSFQTDEIYGFKIAKATLSFSTKEGDRRIASGIVTLSGKSRYDYAKAKQDASTLLRRKIAAEGLFSVIGVK